MSISSSKPISIANTLGTGEKIYNLVFKPGTQSRKLTQDAKYVCQLLAINSDDLIQRGYDDFTERGLSQKRQELRYEHYEEKRQLKLKAIQNILLQCQQRDLTNPEALQVQALLEDIKRQQSTSNGKSKSVRNAGSLNKPYNQSGVSEVLEGTNKSTYIEFPLEKNEKLQKIKEQKLQKRAEQDQQYKQFLLKEQKKLEEIEKLHKEAIDNIKVKVIQQNQKWQQKLQLQKEREKQEENQKLKKGKELDFLYQSFHNEKQDKLRETQQRLSLIDQEKIQHKEDMIMRRSFKDKTDLEMVEEKLKKADARMQKAIERNYLQKQSIINRGLNHSQIVERKKEEAQELYRQKQEKIMNVTYNKALKAQCQQNSRIKEMNQYAQKLQQNHKLIEEKLKSQQDEEKREFRKKIEEMNNKQELIENKVNKRRQELQEQISAKKEKRKLKFEDKDENEQRIQIFKESMKRRILEKHIEKGRRISEMKDKLLNTLINL